METHAVLKIDLLIRKEQLWQYVTHLETSNHESDASSLRSPAASPKGLKIDRRDHIAVDLLLRVRIGPPVHPRHLSSKSHLYILFDFF